MKEKQTFIQNRICGGISHIGCECLTDISKVKSADTASEPARGQVKQYCFTLIELLVVIAIIAILASILMPALSSARERGKSSTCVNNLKTMAHAFGAYSDDHNSFITPQSGIRAKCPYSGWGNDWRWQYGLVVMKYLPSNSWDKTGNSPKVVRGVHNCPSETLAYLEGKDGWYTWKGSQYGMANYVGITYGNTSRSRYFETLGQVKMPSRQARAGDKAPRGDKNTFGMTYENLTTNEFGVGPGATRHLGKINISFIDQHVETRSVEEVPNDVIYGENYWRCAFWSRKDHSIYWNIYPW